MKKTTLFLLIMVMSMSLMAQNTNYGVSSGTGGTNSSFFGYFSGNVVTGADNSYFGISSGRLTTSGIGNTGIGSYTLYNNITGRDNVALGIGALYRNTVSNNVALGSGSMNVSTTGTGNTGVGDRTLYSNTTGSNNTAGGYRTLYNSVGASNNTGYGHQTLYAVTTGADNVAVGYLSMNGNISGSSNTAVGTNALKVYGGSEATAVGAYALYANSSGVGNTAVGNKSLYTVTTGRYNSAFGYQALYLNTAEYNCAFGNMALLNNTTGGYNCAMGSSAMGSNTTGVRNVAVGMAALYANTTGSDITAIGYGAGGSAGDGNTFVGQGATLNVPGWSNSTMLGRGAFATGSDQVRLGNFTVTSIGGVVAYSVVSDGRFKSNFRNDVPGLEFINQLEPVTYDMDRNKISSFAGFTADKDQQRAPLVREAGFVAQKIEEIVSKNQYNFYGVEKPQSDKDTYRVRYSDFVVPIVKALQELSAKVQQQQHQIDSLLGTKTQNFDTGSENTSNAKAALFQNNPNPSSTDTEIRMTVPGDSKNSMLHIYNFEGTQLKTIPVTGKGDVTIKIEAGNFKPGIYLYSLIVDGAVIGVRRMVLTQ